MIIVANEVKKRFGALEVLKAETLSPVAVRPVIRGMIAVVAELLTPSVVIRSVVEAKAAGKVTAASPVVSVVTFCQQVWLPFWLRS